jgi:hypothetical protein
VRFFGTESASEIARQFGRADLIVGNNVLAHVPNINDFVGGLKVLLAECGTATMEFPHLLRLIEHVQFDTIYHEHFSYLSLATTKAIFEKHGLRIVDVEELSTHGGSLRIFAVHADSSTPPSIGVTQVLALERSRGLDRLDGYSGFEERVRQTKRRILEFLVAARDGRRSVVGYGAPGKGNTLLNYCGIRTDFIDYTVDRNPLKQGRLTPGTRIPIFAPDRIAVTRPDFLFVLPWNLRDEILNSMGFVREWGCKFVFPIPSLEIVD